MAISSQSRQMAVHKSPGSWEEVIPRMRTALQIIGALIALSGCQTSPDAPGKPTYTCLVTPNDLVECNEVSD